MNTHYVMCLALCLTVIDCSRHDANPPATGQAPATTITPEARAVSLSGGNVQGKDTTPIRIFVRLIDGSQLIGTPTSTMLPLRSSYGIVDVQLEQVRSMVLKDSSGSVRVEFRNGDILQGFLQNESLSLETLVGPLSIPVARVTTVNVVNPANSITDGLVAYYPLDGNTDDLSGHGHNAVNHGATPATDRFGLPARALAFGGAGEYVALPDGLIDPEAAEFTLALWIMPRAMTGTRYALYLGALLGEAVVFLREGSFAVGPNLGDGIAHNASTPARLDMYAHLVGVYRRGKSIQLWLDGRQSAELPLPNRALLSGQTGLMSAIGVYAPEHPELAHQYNIQPFYGSIDDIRIYHRALTEDEIRFLALDR